MQWDLQDGAGLAAASLLPAAMAVAMLVAGRARVAGTTLVAPWWWTLASVASIAGVEAAVHLAVESSYGWRDPLRYAAAMMSLCPMMALLGAKRPQSGPWQFVVLTMWVVLALPAAEWWLFGSGEAREIHWARLALVVILVAVELFNYLPTRFWPSIVLVVGAQLVLVAPYLGMPAGPVPPGMAAPIGLAIIDGALALVFIGWPRARTADHPLDRVWIDFRDAYGVVWALRVLARANETAGRFGWGLNLTWKGFRGESDRSLSGAEGAQPGAAYDHLAQLLGRFVSPAWIAKRTVNFTINRTADRAG